LPVSEALRFEYSIRSKKLISSSMGIHESQSLLWERMVGLSEPFWEFLTPRMKESFSNIPKDITSQQFYRAFNKSKPGFIRVESDEVTYPMHIILRYEIERDLIEGSLFSNYDSN
jgi:carboxypeptidase Taq